MRNIKRATLNSTILATAAIFLGFMPDAAIAQAQPPVPDASANQVETIIVTARKRSEDLLKVPVSVSALTAKDLAVRGIQTLSDVAAYTPGLTDDQANGGGARSDRSFQQLIIRGMNPSDVSRPTTSIFINGVPVASADFLQNLDDTERVEVLKGPQSAYFGRETFAGAVNVITKTPVNQLGFNLSGEAATRSTFNVSATINVPIVDDKLILRVGGAYDSHSGSYRNAFDPARTLGDQSTGSFHATLLAKPFENLTIKAYGMIFRDSDGAPATGIYLGTGPTTAGGQTPFAQSNCTVAGQPYFCGTLPSLNRAVSPAQVTTISPTVNFANVSQAFLASPGGVLHGSDLVHGFGLRRNAYHGDVNVDYDIPSLGVSLTYLGGFNHNNWSELSDLANEDGSANGQYPGPGTGFPFEVQQANHDMSHEFRIATDAHRRFRALAGASYIDAHTTNGLGAAAYGANGVTFSGATQSKTTGGFFSLAFDVVPQITVNFDGRYQSDKEIAYSAPGIVSAQGTSKKFLPRASIQYRIEPEVMAYFTYSKGVNPVAPGAQFATLPAASQAELTAAGIPTASILKPEELTNYEVGFKGRFLDGRATLSADLYYDKWNDQTNTGTYNFSPDDPANPYNVVGSPTYHAGNTSIYNFEISTSNARTIAKGVEVEATIIPISHVTINAAGAINDTKYKTYECTNCLPYSVFNAAGKYLPNSSKDSFTVGAQYENTTSLFRDAHWFARVDFIYKDGVYIQASNTVKTPNVEYVNLRAGLTVGPASIEGFVNNLFNNKSPVSGFQDYDFAGGFASNVIMVGLPQLITGGVKISIKY